MTENLLDSIKSEPWQHAALVVHFFSKKGRQPRKQPVCEAKVRWSICRQIICHYFLCLSVPPSPKNTRILEFHEQFFLSVNGEEKEEEKQNDSHSC